MLRSRVLPILFVLLACALGLPSASPAGDRRGTGQLTNGQRLARGLPPKSPKRLYSPSRVQARDSSPSSQATPTTAVIEVRRSSDKISYGFLDFVLNSARPNGIAIKTTDIRAESPVLNVVSTPGSGGNKVEIPVDFQGERALLYLKQKYQNDKYYDFGPDRTSDLGSPSPGMTQTTIFTYSGAAEVPLLMSVASETTTVPEGIPGGGRKRVIGAYSSEITDTPVTGIWYNEYQRELVFIPEQDFEAGYDYQVEFWLVPVEGNDRVPPLKVSEIVR